MDIPTSSVPTTPPKQPKSKVSTARLRQFTRRKQQHQAAMIERPMKLNDLASPSTSPGAVK